MPLRLEIKRELSARSERVKCVDLHPSEPWVLAALFSGNMVIWNYATETTLKTFEVSDVPVRSAKFIPRKQWVICGADDMKIRVYNYNTMEKIKTIDAHSDYIRGLAVHPKSPFVLSASDDMSIKMFDWSRDWENTQVFEGHTHYVMQVEINPKDSNSFASASLDRSVKVWGLNSRSPHFSLDGHERGVNCVSYFSGGDRPYIVSGADDQTIKVWDYQTKSCVATLEGHTNNVSSVMFHPVLPLVISGSEDGTVRMWHSTSFRLENTLNYGMERCWSIACDKDTNRVAIGYDEGTIMIKIGHEEPVASMDRNGKVVWAKNHDIIGTNVKTVSKEDITDGERLPLAAKEMGSCEIYPQDMSHDAKARLLAVCGDGEYIIYTALSLKNKSYGPALEFVWASASGVYATRESSSRVKVFKNFAEHQTFRPDFPVEGIFGGHLLGLRSSEFIDFYDWDTCSIVRRIEICPRHVFWSDSGDIAVVCDDTSFYVLSFNRELVAKYINQGIQCSEQGIDGSFELEKNITETVVTGQFVGDCFIYTTQANRINYCVGGEVITLAHLSKPFYLLGYLPRENRVYLIDKQHNIVSFQLLVDVLVYETAIVRRDMEAAAEVFASIPSEHHAKLARFLEGQGLREEALRVTTDPEHQFELAIQLNDLALAKKLAETDDSDIKWKQVGDSALANFDLETARFCFERANDFGALLLLTSSLGDAKGIERLAQLATKAGRFNVAFVSLFLSGHVEKCLELLAHCGRFAEAAIMARAYAPSHVPRLVALWRESIKEDSPTVADSLADPLNNAEMFPEFENLLKAETFLSKQRSQILRSESYSSAKQDRESDVLKAVQEGELGSLNPTAIASDQVDTNVLSKESVFSETEEAPVSPAAIVQPQVHYEVSEASERQETGILSPTEPLASEPAIEATDNQFSGDSMALEQSTSPTAHTSTSQILSPALESPQFDQTLASADPFANLMTEGPSASAGHSEPDQLSVGFTSPVDSSMQDVTQPISHNDIGAFDDFSFDQEQQPVHENIDSHSTDHFMQNLGVEDSAVAEAQKQTPPAFSPAQQHPEASGGADENFVDFMGDDEFGDALNLEGEENLTLEEIDAQLGDLDDF